MAKVDLVGGPLDGDRAYVPDNKGEIAFPIISRNFAPQASVWTICQGEETPIRAAHYRRGVDGYDFQFVKMTAA